ncbi:MAG: malate dehydrogenase [Candidatus Omnitrophica bacterium]|nr:malate dehydrogenase [Candidatus Omnitrophota bacterium]
MKRSPVKITVVGAGAVGSTLAMRIAEKGLADVVLLDIYRNIAAGKALDILDASPVIGHEQGITGTDDYSEIKGSRIVVITAGLPRKPGMTREELISKNAAIVRDVAEKVKANAPDAIVILVTNPLDTMTFLAHKVTGFKRERVFGMAGILDGSRFTQLAAAELKIPRSSIKALMLGSHGDTMVPVISQTRVSGKPIKDMLKPEALDRIIKRSRDRGAEIVGLLGTGSAYYSPSAAVLPMIEAILNDTKETLVVSACLDGEYGLKGLAIGVPCRIGSSGIEKIEEMPLAEEEKKAFLASAEAIKKTIELL